MWYNKKVLPNGSIAMEGYLKDGTFYKQTRVVNELCSDTGEALIINWPVTKFVIPRFLGRKWHFLNLLFQNRLS